MVSGLHWPLSQTLKPKSTNVIDSLSQTLLHSCGINCREIEVTQLRHQQDSSTAKVPPKDGEILPSRTGLSAQLTTKDAYPCHALEDARS